MDGTFKLRGKNYLFTNLWLEVSISFNCQYKEQTTVLPTVLVILLLVQVKYFLWYAVVVGISKCLSLRQNIDVR